MSGPIREAYDAWHAALAVDEAADAPWQLLVRAHLPALDGQRVLEMGCGRGGFAAALAREHGARVVGADFSRTAIALAAAHRRAARIERLDLLVADIGAIPHPDGVFDAVISCETVEHVPDPRLAVRECARVLRPGGRLYLTTSNYLGIMGLYRAYRRLAGHPYTEVGQPINRLTLLPRTVGWVRAAGLRIVAVDAAGHYLPVPGRPPVVLPLPIGVGRALRWFALNSLVVGERR
ncbi:MAG: class I SAM-dependent methyltransferase [Gemmatimonadales bacterium]